MSRVLTLRLDEETAAVLEALEKASPELSTNEIIREAIGASTSVVYVLQRPDGAVRIGHTPAMSVRMANLMAEYGELKLIHMFPGGRSAWASLRAKLEKKCIAGEWYSAGTELADAIEAVRTFGAEPKKGGGK